MIVFCVALCVGKLEFRLIAFISLAFELLAI